jgi:tripartite-type tricarboxylate transporter receptor subunit TctC
MLETIMRNHNLLANVLAIFITYASFTATAQTQTYPNKTITLVVPFAPGGNIDVIARAIGPSLAKVTGQSVVVENKPGAGGAIGSTYVARAEPDGYSLLVATTNTISVLPYMLKAPPYKPEGFEPISLAATSPLVLVVRKDDKRFPDAKALFQVAKNTPESISVGHAGPGTSNHIAILRLEEATKTNFNVIPYKGSAPALTDLMGGQIDFVVDQITSSKPFIDAGKLKVIAVLSRERPLGLTESPTLREAIGVDLDLSTTAGILAPPGTPQNVVKSLNAALRKAIDDSGVRGRLSAVGSTAKSSTPQEWAMLLNQESSNSQALLQAGKIKAE